MPFAPSSKKPPKFWFRTNKPLWIYSLMADTQQSPTPDNKKRNRDLLDNIFTHDYADKAHIGRMAMAAGYGLDPAVAQPFPPLPSQTINMTNTNQRSGLAKFLGGAALGASLLAGGGLGTAAFLGAFSKPEAAKSVDVEVPWHFKDGKMDFGSPQIKPVEK